MTSENYLFFFGVFVAAGLFLWLLGRAVFDRHPQEGSIYRAPWLGYALLVAFLQITHLFLPIDQRFSITIVIGLALITFVSLLLAPSPGKWTLKRAATALGAMGLALGISFLAFLPVLNGCTKSMCHIDLGVYYLKLIRWTQTFPIVPGLVNLQEQLAFNQNAFLITSLFDSLVPNRWGIFLIAGFLPWLGLTLSLFALVQLILRRWRQLEGAPPIEIAYAISIPAWLSTLATSSISSASPDCIISSLSIHFFLVFACYVTSSDESGKARDFGEIFLLGVLCLSVKSSSLGLVLGIFAATIALLLIKRKRNAGDIFIPKRVAAMSVLAAVMMATWMWRGVILSGYPFFPSTAMAMPVPWRMPVKGIKEVQHDTVRWARDPDPGSDRKEILKTWRWLPRWSERLLAMRTHFAWPAQVGLAGSAVLAAFALYAPALRRHTRSLVLLTIPLVLYTAFWFITAPDPRYFGSTMWIFAICPALTFAGSNLRLGLSSTLACLGVAAIPIFFLAWEFRWAWSYAEERLPTFTVVETRPVENPHGVVIWLNPNGIQTYDSPLPSSWKPRPFVAFLNPQKGIAGGFKYLPPPKSASSLTRSQ
jgi:hypothetical protein